MKHPYTYTVIVNGNPETYYSKEYVSAIKQEQWWRGFLLGDMLNALVVVVFLVIR